MGISSQECHQDPKNSLSFMFVPADGTFQRLFMISYLDDEILVSIFTYYSHQDPFELLFTISCLRRFKTFV